MSEQTGAVRGGFDLSRLKGAIPDNVITQISEAAVKFNLTTPLRLAHFLSQCSHESGNFTLVQENLNYSAKGLLGTFGKYFPTQALAEQYQKQPEKIASRVYGSRMGNGDESSKEGYKFRGRGYIQLTGKDNYASFSQSVNEDCVSNPDLVATKYPLSSAAWFFQKCLSKCDLGATREAIESVTKCVNGGLNGIEDRVEKFNKFYKLLS